jgi:GntR family transcriptional regulator
MVSEWSDNTPIYVQLRERVLAQILEGAIKPGEPLPSVRQVAGELAINPLTVSKAYQTLTDEGVVEKRRGLGLYVAEGADRELRLRERERFLHEDWPQIVARIRRLELAPETLLREL